ncbi:MAG TPA: (Fe-S)-binding protein [Symbiobacteriaceae bacterium]|jgi:glycolate oxidase iron-sulfur subunit
MSLAESLSAQLREEEIIQCMRCGFCLSACPTYKLYGREANSPRGRIALANAVLRGEIPLNDITLPLDQCIGCRACETACPAGVHYGTILEAARSTNERSRPRGVFARLFRKVAFEWILGTPGGIKLAGFGLWFWQATGLATVIRGTGLVKAIAGAAAADLDRAMPAAPSPAVRRAGGGMGTVFPAVGPKRARAAFFTGCIMEMAFYQENRDSIRLLQAVGCEVVIVPGQGCCGAVHTHAGEEPLAYEQAKRNIAAFEAETGADFIVLSAGGCGAALKEYKLWFQQDQQWALRAAAFSAKVKDLSEVLVAMGPLPLKERKGRLTYQDSCHLRNVQKVVSQPRQLLTAIPGGEFVELPGADGCCGAGGIYNVTQPETANHLGNEKIDRLQQTGATTLVVTNPPCQLHMQASLMRSGLDQRGVAVKHIATVLCEALDREESQ